MKRPEQALQIQVANYLRVALRPETIWTAIGHGGGGKVRGAILKAMGLQAGWPDILIMWPGNGCPKVLGIELKVAGGALSPAQREVQAAWRGCNAGHVVCRSLWEVEQQLLLAHVPLKARLA